MLTRAATTSPPLHQVDSLRPGRAYRVRVRITVQLPPEDEPFTKLVCEPSDAAAFDTQPTAPSTAAPPTLASRDRKAL